MPDLSVVICTYRRPDLLRDLLGSLAAQREVQCAAEVVVVDNDPSRSARDIVDQQRASLACPIAYVPEPRPGVSHARNAGVAVARGDCVLFLDDDQLIPADFLARVWSAWLARPLQLRGLRIRVEPRRASGERRAGARLVVNSASADYAPVLRGDFGTGGLLVERALLQSFEGPFRADLGRLGGEDTELFLRASERGFHFGHLASVTIEERVTAQRDGLANLIRRQLRSGLLDAELDAARADARAELLAAQRPTSEEAARLALARRSARARLIGVESLPGLWRLRATVRLALAPPRSALALTRRALWLGRSFLDPDVPIVHRLQHVAYLTGRTLAAASERALPPPLARRAVSTALSALSG